MDYRQSTETLNETLFREAYHNSVVPTEYPYFQFVIRFGVLFAVGIALVRAGMWLAIDPLYHFGLVFSIVSVYGFVREDRWIREKRAAQIAAIKSRHAPPTVPTPVPRYAPVPDPDPVVTKLKRIEVIPPDEFLTWLWDQQRVVGEEATEKRWGNAADEWYDALAATGWIVGRDGERRLPGTLHGTVEECRAYWDKLRGNGYET